MWWARTKSLEVYLAEGQLGVLGRGELDPSWSFSHDSAGSLEMLAKHMQSCKQDAAWQVRIWLSATLARPFLLPAGSGVRNRREALVVAGALAADATNLTGATRTWLGHWRAGSPTLGVGIGQDLWEQIQTVFRETNANRAHRHAIKMISVRPWWNLAFDHAVEESKAEAGAMAWTLSEDGGLLHWVLENGQLSSIGYDNPGMHDASAEMLKRRLQVGWVGVSMTKHVFFKRIASEGRSASHVIGDWSDDHAVSHDH